jgi:non-ribosomal peptide synthetase component F
MESSGYVDKLSSVAGQASKEEAYWLNRLSGELGKSSFPYDYGKIGRPRRTMETCRFQFTGPVYSRIMKMVNGSYPRLHMVLSAALVSLLYTYGSSDIMVGTSIYKQEIDGEFINTVLALRCRLEAAMTFKEVILQVREVITAAVEHQNFPIEFILQELGIPLGKNDDFPLFDVGILLENIQDKAYIRHIRLQMLFSFLDSGDSLEAAVEYNGALYKQETVADLLKRFDQLLCQVLENVNLSLADLDILTDEEKRRLLLTFNRTGAEYPREQTIIELFRRQVEKTPDHTAVVHDRHQVTYNRLDRAAGLLSGRLCQRGVKRESLVALQGAPSLAAILGIVGILKTGAAYLPLDPETPGRRLEYIVKDSRPTLLLFTGTFPEAEQGIFPALPPDRLISLDDRSLYTSVPEPDRPRRENCGQPRDVAYVIYTSGTTARPKGVMVHQQGLVNYVWWAAGRYVRNERGNFPLFTSIAFDLTVTSIFTPLITGNAVVVYAYREEGQAIPVEEIIRQNRVDIVKLTASHLRIVQHISGKGSGLKRFIVGGEELDTSLAREISRHFNHPVEIYNEYGPTETVVGCMCHRYDPGSDNGPSVPLGFPIANMRV